MVRKRGPHLRKEGFRDRFGEQAPGRKEKSCDQGHLDNGLGMLAGASRQGVHRCLR